MAEDLSNGLFAIDIDPDDCAETAAGDTPSVPRTFQSEADFQAQKASYSAKIDTGNNHAELIKAVPQLANNGVTHSKEMIGGEGKVNLTKKNVQLLGYAVGEMYYDGKYKEIVELCGMVRERCGVEEGGKLDGTLERWVGRSRGRMERGEEARKVGERG